jgi:hypothetical protein
VDKFLIFGHSLGIYVSRATAAVSGTEGSSTSIPRYFKVKKTLF